MLLEISESCQVDGLLERNFESSAEKGESDGKTPLPNQGAYHWLIHFKNAPLLSIGGQSSLALKMLHFSPLGGKAYWL
jgi:hypothetical protein